MEIFPFRYGGPLIRLRLFYRASNPSLFSNAMATDFTYTHRSCASGKKAWPVGEQVLSRQNQLGGELRSEAVAVTTLVAAAQH